MPAITENRLKEQLSAGEFSRLYVLAGEEKYLVGRAAKRLIKAAAGQVFPELNSNEFDSTATADALIDAVISVPFMAEHKCVSAADLDLDSWKQEELDKLFELMENVPESTTLVFWYPTLDWDGQKSAKWKNFLKRAEKEGDVLFCGRREVSDLRRILMREAEKAGCVLARENASRILDYAGQDLTLLFNEIQKLCAFALGSRAEGDQAPPEITAGMIDELVSRNMETTVFLMARALVEGNYSRAYSLMDQLFYQKEKPVAILGALSSSYVDMYRVRAALESGLSAQAPAEYGDYKRKEFRLKNAERNIRGVHTGKLRKSLELLLEADLALKGSRLDDRVILDELIAKLLLTARSE